MKENYPDTHHDVSSNTIFGFWVYLMTDAVMFATFFAAYAVLYTGTAGGPGPKEIFNLPYALTETLILLTSSFSCGMALLSASKSHRNRALGWFALTFLLGLTFLYMGVSELAHLNTEGNGWQRSAFLSSYFTLIGTHGLHVIVGLLLLILFIAQFIHRGLTTVVLRRLTCFRIYWQFLYFIWIFTFAIVYLIGAK